MRHIASKKKKTMSDTATEILGDYPVTVDDMIRFMNIVEYDDATASKIDEQIKTVIQQVEKRLNKDILFKTRELVLKEFTEKMQLTLPVVAVNAITYLDTNGDEQNLSVNDYIVDKINGYIYRRYCRNYPDTYPQYNAVTIEYQSGYEKITDIEPSIILAIKNGVGSWIATNIGTNGTASNVQLWTVNNTNLLNPFIDYRGGI